MALNNTLKTIFPFQIREIFQTSGKRTPHVLLCGPFVPQGGQNEHHLALGDAKVVPSRLWSRLILLDRDKNALIKKKKGELLRADLTALCKELVKR